MDVVWEEFIGCFGTNMNREEVGILVAYNGETCDLKGLWKLTQAPRSPYDLPSKLKYFMDPLKVIGHYSGCKLNPKHSKLDSLELGVVWKHINEGANLNGAHCSLVEAKAQADIFLHPAYVPYLTKT